MSDIYYPHGIDFATTLFRQIDALPFEPNDEPFVLRSASAVLPGFSSSNGINPMLNFSTTQAKTVLDTCTADQIAAGTTSNVDIEFRKSSSLTGRVALATTGHIRVRGTRSLLTWDGFDAAANDNVRFNCRLQMISDGTNDPIAVSIGVAAGIAIGVTDVFTLGPVSLTTTTLSGTLCVKAVRWSNNIRYREERCSTTNHVHYAGVEESNPTIMLTVEDMAKAMALLNKGEPISALTLYLRKKLAGGMNVPNGTAEHIKLTASTGRAYTAGPRQIMLQVHSFAVDSASAIT